MKRLAGILMALLASSAFAGENLIFAVKVEEPSDRPKEAIRWPVTVGVPFHAGDLDDQTPLMLRNAGDQAVYLQTQVIGRWLPKPGKPQWVLLDFQGDFGGQSKPHWSVTAFLGVPQVPAYSEPLPRLQVDDAADKINIDTGAVSFAVDKKHFGLFENLKTAEGQVLDGSSIYWIDEQGHRYEAKAYGEPKVELELKGPMRAVIKAEGWYARTDAPNQKMMRYQVRIAAFAGLPYVRIYHTLIWTEDDKVKMKEWGLSFHLAQEAAEGLVGVVGGKPITGALDKPLEAVQDTCTKKPQLSGWAQAGGLAVAVMDLNMQLPKAYTLRKDAIDVQLWAPQAGLLSMAEKDRLQDPNMPNDKRNKEWLATPQQGGVSPRGVAKTHEIWLWPVGGKTPPAEAINDYVQRPPVAMADPAYQCSTDALPGLRPAADTPPQYRFIEDAFRAMFDEMVMPLDKLKDFETFNFGVAHVVTATGWRAFDDNGFCWSQVPWMMFYRSGNRDYFTYGVRNSRHVMDEAVCHDGAERGPAYSKVVGYTYQYSPLPWGWGPLWDEWWTHPQYLLHYYHMTGYERAADVLGEMAKVAKISTVAPTVEENRARHGSVERAQYGNINPKCVYYEFTGDPWFLSQAHKWSDLAIAYRDKDGRFTDNLFFGFFYRGLYNTWLHTDPLAEDQNVRQAILGVVKDFAEPPADPLTAPFWGRDDMIPFAAACRIAHNEHYLDYPIRRIMDEMHLVQTAGPITPWAGGRGYSAMSRTLAPIFLDSAFDLMGAWHDAGFKPVGPWLGNNPFLASHPIDEAGGFKSCMTLYVRKDAGKGGKLALVFQESNYGTMENLDRGTKKMEARITGPDGQKRVVPANLVFQPLTENQDPYHQPEPIAFAADLPAGVYRVDVVGQQQLFWLAPRTDLPGLVIEVPDHKLSCKFRRDPSRVYMRLEPGRDALTFKLFGSRVNVVTPFYLAGPDGQSLGLYPYPAPRTMTFKVPEAARDKMLALVMGYTDYVPFDMNLPGVEAEGAQPYFAVQSGQWFDPKAAR